MTTIDFKLQHVIFNKLIKQKSFNYWKKPWHVHIRDFKPYYLYQISERILDQELYKKTNLEFKHREVNFNQPKSTASINELDESQQGELQNFSSEINKLRTSKMKTRMVPILEQSFKDRIRKTGEMLV
jgi:hypothetical protein